MRRRGRRPRAHGQARQSQLLTTYGPGAMVDLPRWAAVVAGLDEWLGAHLHPVHEERLVAKVESALDRRPLGLFAPPIDTDEGPVTGVPVHVFPRWFVGLYERRSGNLVGRPLLPLEMLTPPPRRRYRADDNKTYPVIPVRFVQACVNGHLDDVEWRRFVHDWQDGCQKPLWLEERGTSGDFVDIFVRCECGKRRSLAELLPTEARVHPMGYCRGERPWLGPFAREECHDEEGRPVPNKLLVRSASHAYFPQVLSVIHIPDRDADLRKAIDSVWEANLLYVDDLESLKRERQRKHVQEALADFQDEERILALIRERKEERAADPKTIKLAEMETLLASGVELVDDTPRGDYFARTLPSERLAAGPMSAVERIVLVHRLREVRALIGFSRFEPISPDIHGEYPEVSQAEISREADWVPAVENFGEGFFLGLREEALADWESRPEVQARLDQLRAGFERARRGREEFPGPRYVLLHSLSHLLITAVSLECGYAAAAIRERIYVTEAGCGILLFTASPGSEGTLGGLVEVGRNVERHLAAALDVGRLCANDPVCAGHEPSNTYEERYRHGAACHGCLLIAEPSCERYNFYLDRALVVPTVHDRDCAFFRDLP